MGKMGLLLGLTVAVCVCLECVLNVHVPAKAPAGGGLGSHGQLRIPMAGQQILGTWAPVMAPGGGAGVIEVVRAAAGARAWARVGVRARWRTRRAAAVEFPWWGATQERVLVHVLVHVLSLPCAVRWRLLLHSC